MRRKRVATVILLLLVGIVVMPGLWLWSQQQQYVRNRQLIAALVKGDTTLARLLVKQGADPNTRLTSPPVPSLRQLLQFLFHRSAKPSDSDPTAFFMACGASFVEYDAYGKDAPQLVEAMLQYGINANAKDEQGYTPLYWAVVAKRPQTVGVLLQHGASDKAKYDVDQETLLELACDSEDADSVRLLLDHGADVNATDRTGHTVLGEAVALACIDKTRFTVMVNDIIPQLMAHGADPKKGYDNPLEHAQYNKRTDILIWLRGESKEVNVNRRPTHPLWLRALHN